MSGDSLKTWWLRCGRSLIPLCLAQNNFQLCKGLVHFTGVEDCVLDIVSKIFVTTKETTVKRFCVRVQAICKKGMES